MAQNNNKFILLLDDGIYEDNIKKIGQFPEKRHFSSFNYNQDIVSDTSRFWLKA